MQSTHLFETRADHLHMTVSGEYNFDDFITYVQIMRDKCEMEQTFRILMNALDVGGIDIPTMERYFMGIEVAEKFSFKIKLAIVWHKEYINHFGETVAVNRGAQVGVFGNIEAAQKWLLHDIRE